LVDDTKTNIDILVQALREHYKLGVALNGRKAIDYARTHQPDLILLDIMMPEMDGLEASARLQAMDETRSIPIIFITAMDDAVHKSKGFEHGAVDYITKPFDVNEVKARVKTHLSLKIARERLERQNEILEERVQERTQEIARTQAEIVDRLGLAAEYRDEGTGNHIKRMSEFCRVLGKSLGLGPAELDLLAQASTMHDVGKIGISDNILLKPGPLTDEEFSIMKSHAVIGAKLLSGSECALLKAAKEIAETHHERFDGSGYPHGLAGEAIPLYGRIACIADVFDALISARPYKPAWPLDQALAEIEKGAGRHFDPRLVPLFAHNREELERIVQLLP
jgi:putative two-component system response regulator